MARGFGALSYCGPQYIHRPASGTFNRQVDVFTDAQLFVATTAADLLHLLTSCNMLGWRRLCRGGAALAKFAGTICGSGACSVLAHLIRRRVLFPIQNAKSPAADGLRGF